MKSLSVLLSALVLAAAGAAHAESGFLDDYALLKPVPTQSGEDLVYVAPDAMARLAPYDQVLIDQPVVLMSPDSEYTGAKPEDLAILAETVRAAVANRLAQSGYRVVDAPGPNVAYLRLGVTELYLKKKKRSLLAYTPVGAVVKAGVDSTKETLEKVDVIEMALEMEFTDSTSGDLFGAAVVRRGARKAEGQKMQRMDFDEFMAVVDELGSRLSCRLHNAKLPEAQRIDCSDPAARAAPRTP